MTHTDNVLTIIASGWVGATPTPTHRADRARAHYQSQLQTTPRHPRRPVTRAFAPRDPWTVFCRCTPPTPYKTPGHRPATA